MTTDEIWAMLRENRARLDRLGAADRPALRVVASAEPETVSDILADVARMIRQSDWRRERGRTPDRPAAPVAERIAPVIELDELRALRAQRTAPMPGPVGLMSGDDVARGRNAHPAGGGRR